MFIHRKLNLFIKNVIKYHIRSTVIVWKECFSYQMCAYSFKNHFLRVTNPSRLLIKTQKKISKSCQLTRVICESAKKYKKQAVRGQVSPHWSLSVSFSCSSFSHPLHLHIYHPFPLGHLSEHPTSSLPFCKRFYFCF